MKTSPTPGSSGRARIRVLCVDPQAIVLEGLSASLRLDPRLDIVDLVDDMPEALRRIEQLRPDVVLTELGLPDHPGVDVVKAFRRIDPAVRVIVLTGTGGDLRARRAMAAGASAFLLKTRMAQDIADAVESVFAGDPVIDLAVLHDLSTPAVFADDLEDREVEVLRLTSAGRTAGDIDQAMRLANGTARRLLLSAQAKLGASDRTHAVMLAITRGLIEIGRT